MLSKEQQLQKPDPRKQAKLFKASRERMFKEEQFDKIDEMLSTSPDIDANMLVPDIATQIVTAEADKMKDEHVPTIASTAVMLASELQEQLVKMDMAEPLEVGSEEHTSLIFSTMESTLTKLADKGIPEAEQGLAELDDMKKQMAQGGQEPQGIPGVQPPTGEPQQIAPPQQPPQGVMGGMG